MPSDGSEDVPPSAGSNGGQPGHRRTTLTLFDTTTKPHASEPVPVLDHVLDGPEAIPEMRLDVAGCVLAVNDAARRLLGIDAASSPAGRPLDDLGLRVDDLHGWLEKAADRQVPVPAIARLASAGLPRLVAVTGTWLHDVHQMQVWMELVEPGVSSGVSDVSGPDLLAAIELAAGCARVGFAINTLSPDGLWRMAYINPSGAAVLGRQVDQLVGGPAFPDAEFMPAKGEPTIVEGPGPASDSLLEIGVSPGRYRGREAVFVLFKDVTEVQPNEQERKRLVQELFNANVDLRNFARATTHDLRAPLRSISGFAALLERRIRGRLDDDDVRLINNILSSTRRMDQLIEALAAYSSLGAGRVEIEHVELNAILGDVLSDLSSELDQLDIHLEFTSLPAIRGDALLLRRLFQNLLGNAIKFRHQVPHRVRLEAEPQDDFVMLHFSDNGVGIDLHHADDMFQPFRRFHDLAKFPGSGLGLATCKRIVDIHGGTIEVRSEPGVGSTFTVRLPV